MARGLRNEILLGAFFILVIGILVLMYRHMGGRAGRNTITVAASFESVVGLVPDNHVMVAGVPVGLVVDIRVVNNRARVTMQIDSAIGLRRDTAAHIQARSLLGEKFVALVPKSSDAPLLKDGDTIADTHTPVTPDEVFVALKPFIDQLEPAGPKMDSILNELDQLLKELNKTSENGENAVGKVIDRTDQLLVQANSILSENKAKISRSLTRLDTISAQSAEKLPRILSKTEQTISKLDNAASSIPVETISRLPEGYEKIDRILDRMSKVVERIENTGESADSLLKNLDILVKKVLGVDELVLRRFLQEEGVKVNLIQDGGSKRRIEELERQQVPEKP